MKNLSRGVSPIGFLCPFDTRPRVKAFLAGWFGFGTLVGGMMFVVSSVAILQAFPKAPVETWLGVLGPLAILGFGFCLLRFGQYRARG